MKPLKNKLNLGCGTSIRGGYINVDIAKLKGVDVVWDLNKYPWPFKDNQFEEIFCGSNILAFLDNFVRAMEEIWRVSKPGCKILVEAALYPGINCFSDPYVKKIFTYNSFVYFEPGEKLNYYTKARFKVIERKIIFSSNRFLKSVNSLPNLFPKFYIRFLSFIFPPIGIIFMLKAIK